MNAVNLLNLMNVDYRKLNFLRLTLLKENNNLMSISVKTFIKSCANILKIPSFEESELFFAIKDCISESSTKVSDYDSENISLM